MGNPGCSTACTEVVAEMAAGALRFAKGAEDPWLREGPHTSDGLQQEALLSSGGLIAVKKSSTWDMTQWCRECTRVVQ
jgi:hypothetical protein